MMREARVRHAWRIALLVALIVCLLPAGALAAPGGLPNPPAERWIWQSSASIVGLQSSITISQDDATARFAQDVRFTLHARGDASIREVILFYRIAGGSVVTRAYPDMTPGRDVTASFTWQLEPGELPPGSEITYWWEVSDNAGGQLRTGDQSITYDDDRFQWKESDSGLVRLYYYGNTRPDALLKTALAAIDKQQSDIGIQLTQPVRIYVYANKSDMSKAIPSRSEAYDAATTTLGIALGDDVLLLLGNASGLDQTVAHELSHIVVGQATAGPLSRLPRWLSEGLAMYAEGTLPAGYRSALDRAVRTDSLISVRSLSGYSGDPEQVDLFYGESQSLVTFLLDQYGRDKMNELLGVFKVGAYQEDALQKVYGFGLDELDTRWRAKLGLGPRQPATTPAAVPTPAPSAIPQLCGASLLPAVVLGLLGLLRLRGAAA